MPCPYCAAELKPGALFCHHCGRRLAARSEVMAPAEAAATVPAGDVIAAAETREFVLESLLPNPAILEPLAPATIIGDRYRVERPLEDNEAGRQYVAFDLLGEERCWSCNTAWNDTDQYCARCGAERRGARVVLHEEPASPERIAVLTHTAEVHILDGDRLFVIEGPFEDRADAFEATAPGNLPLSASALPPTAAAWVEDSQAGTDARFVSATMTKRLPAEVPANPVPPDPPVVYDLQEQNEAPTIEATFFGLMPSALPGAAKTRAPQILLGVKSDVGRARRAKANEDTALVLSLVHAGDDVPAPLTLCVVADGLGGHDGGQRAGRLAARIIANHVIQSIWLPALEGQQAPVYDPITLGDALRGGILEANTRIVATNVLEAGDMGCTVTALIAQGDAACVANVGDSRTYHYDGTDLHRVTIDHSLVARLVAARMLDPDEVYTHPQRSQIYRSLGDTIDLQVDLFPRHVHPGDRFILCSDGLWEMVRDPEIQSLVATHEHQPQQLAEQLVQAANIHGGEDNVTVIVAQVMP